ncbi:hypothetical protein FJZ19_02660 [Candidatus Pacearchaeota archaeon]|nr:hypothetical protein [Candidatus Pacearchaeota archaeon]
MTEKITCQIWAEEDTHGFRHRCHAESRGLAGHTYPRGDIEQKLKSTPIGIPGTNGVWVLLACEPNHDGAACESCQYRHYKGLSHYYDLKKQRKALIEAKARGADIRRID